MYPDNKIIISVEGNIGVGKSTFINILRSNWPGGCEVISEPVDMWKNIVGSNGKNILQTFYEDIPRWAYSFQNVVYITRMMKMEKIIRNSTFKHIFLDRSLETDKNVFEAMLHDQGHLSQIEHSMYNLWCDFYHQYVRPQDNKIYIYLQASPEICAVRIKKRARIEEESIRLDYLKELNDYHDAWLLKEPNVIVIDCEEEFESYESKHIQMINQIKSKLYSIMHNQTHIQTKLKKIEIELKSDSKLLLGNKIVVENI